MNTSSISVPDIDLRIEDRFTDIIGNPYIILIGLVILVTYYLFFNSIPSSSNIGASTMGQTSSTVSMTSSLKTIALFVIASGIFIVIYRYYEAIFGISIKADLKNVLDKDPKINLSISGDNDVLDNIKKNVANKGLSNKDEVFHVPGNYFTYPQAKALCKAYGSRLASYNEVEDAYRKGGEWCSYGWSSDQLALFPTQKGSWKKLQKVKGHENDCGRPGINGGYISNKAVRFGVNCFGKKPSIKNMDSQAMHDNVLPQSKQDQAIEKHSEFLKEKIPEILVSPFNRDSWNMV